MEQGLDYQIELQNSVTSSKTVPSSSASIFVSLYLVILAFFILMNSISTIHKDISADIIEGVNQTFSDSNRELGLEEKVEIEGADFIIYQYLAIIEGLVKQAVTLVDVGVERKLSGLEFTIDKGLLFEGGHFNIRSEQEEFIKNLTAELVALQELAKIDVELIIGTENHNKQDDLLSVKRAGNFANILLNNEVLEESILIGLDANVSAEKVKIGFYIRSLVVNAADSSLPNNLEELNESTG